MTSVVVRTRRLELVWCAVWLLMMGLAPAAQAQNDDAFKRGIEALERKQWAEVVKQMQQAIQVDPKDNGRKVRLGGFIGIRTREIDYFPHFFLGQALFEQGNCAAAVDAWATAEQQAVVRATASFKTLQAGYVACEARGVLPPIKLQQSVTLTTQQINEVNQQATRVTTLGQAYPDLWRADVREQYERASDEIEAARAKLQAGTKTRAERDFNDANVAAERAKGFLVTLESTLVAAIDARRSFESQARDVEQLIAAAAELDRSIDARNVALPPAVSSARQEGRDAMGLSRGRLESAKATSSSAALNEARALAQDASSRFTQVLRELARIAEDGQKRLLADALRVANEAFGFIDGAVATLDRLATQRPAFMGPDKIAEREAIQRQVTQARGRYESARKSENLTGVIAATRLTAGLRDRLSALIATFGPLTLVDRGVHAALVDGARLFLNGEYQQAVAALNPPGGIAADAPLQLHVHLFRAAALHALFERSRETDQSLRAGALAEVEQCKQLNAAFQPDPRAFPPRFISFFQNDVTAAVKTATPAASSR